jgi:ribonuclease HI
MKESSCHNPKMAAYYQEICKLEDKFDSLKLNHVPRWLNELADELAKMASSREPVPIGIFASYQHQPSIRYEEPE